MLCGNVSDQLLDQHRFSQRPRRQTDQSSASGMGSKKVYDLDAGLQQFRSVVLLGKKTVRLGG